MKITEPWQQSFHLEAREISAYIRSHKSFVHKVRMSGFFLNDRHFDENHWAMSNTFSFCGQAGNDVPTKLRVMRTRTHTCIRGMHKKMLRLLLAESNLRVLAVYMSVNVIWTCIKNKEINLEVLSNFFIISYTYMIMYNTPAIHAKYTVWQCVKPNEILANKRPW